MNDQNPHALAQFGAGLTHPEAAFKLEKAGTVRQAHASSKIVSPTLQTMCTTNAQ